MFSKLKYIWAIYKCKAIKYADGCNITVTKTIFKAFSKETHHKQYLVVCKYKNIDPV